MKKISCLFLSFTLLMLFSACVPLEYHNQKYGLEYQENTSWISEDGKIQINVYEKMHVEMTIRFENEIIECRVFGTQVHLKNDVVVEMENGEERISLKNPPIEVWIFNNVYGDSFVATVDWHTTYFVAGQKIKFVKVTGETGDGGLSS